MYSHTVKYHFLKFLCHFFNICKLALRFVLLNKLIVDTVIPKYNSKFYEKAGFKPMGDVYCEFPGNKIKALRLAKKLNIQKS